MERLLPPGTDHRRSLPSAERPRRIRRCIYQRLHWHTWTTREEIIEGAWLELYKAVGFSNQILADMKAADNKILPAPTQRLFIAETRALRAYFYWMLCDLFGNVPIV
ncbi:MAG: hypothetical protein ACLSGF_10360 [Alistipes onderdonkii]